MAEFSGIEPEKRVIAWYRHATVLVAAVLLVILSIFVMSHDAAAQQVDASEVVVLDARIAGDDVRTRFVLDLNKEIKFYINID